MLPNKQSITGSKNFVPIPKPDCPEAGTRSRITEFQYHLYTPEQLEIIKMYASAERQGLIDAGKDLESSKMVEIEDQVVDTCAHSPTKI